MRILFGSIISAAALITVVLHLSKVPEDITAAVVAGLFGALPILDQLRIDRTTSKSERIQQFVGGEGSNPFIVTFYVICFLQLIFETIALLFGVALGFISALQSSSLSALDAYQQGGIGGGIFAYMFGIFLIVPIAKFVAYRIKRLPLLWITAAIVIDAIINWLLYAVVGMRVVGVHIPWQTIFLRIAVELVLLMPGAAIGVWWAKRTRGAYQMSRLFNHLSARDQESIIELLKATPEET